MSVMSQAKEIAIRLKQADSPEEQEAIISDLPTQRVVVIGSDLRRLEAFLPDHSSIGLIWEENGRLHLMTNDEHNAVTAELHGEFLSSDPTGKE